MFNRRFYSPSMWNEMERIQREMNQLFDTSFTNWSPSQAEFPAIALWSGQEGAIISTEVPGVKPEDIDINVLGQTVTISGTREPDKMNEEVQYHRHERQSGRFTRSIELPYTVDSNHVQASFEKGVLYINLPRTESEKPKKITVKSN
jgi:HSP20 family protein